MHSTKRQDGFLLLEFVCFLMIFSVFILLVHQAVVLIRQHAATVLMHTNRSVELALVCDVLGRDIAMAQSPITGWDAQRSVFTVAYLSPSGPMMTNICWELKENYLRRSQGIYDFTQHAWKKRAHSKLPIAAQSFTLRLLCDASGMRVVAAACVITDMQGKQHTKIFPLMAVSV